MNGNGNGQQVATRDDKMTALEAVLVQGDLAKLTTEQRIQYVGRVCESLGMNHLTRPFQFLNLSGKTVMYATRDATDQLRKINGVSIRLMERQFTEGLCIVHVQATDRSGRTDEATGAVPVLNLKGDALANALLKCETKAKRRVTLSICGLGWLDETEAEPLAAAPPRVTAGALIAQAKTPPARTELSAHDLETGEIRDDLGLLPIDQVADPADLLALASRLETDMLAHETQAELKAWFSDSPDVTRLRDGGGEFYTDLLGKVKSRMKALKK